jgi:ribosome maturation factor RimP
MISEKHIRKMAEHELKGTENYLVSVLVKPGNKIMVFIDNDNDIGVDDCVKLSRAIEGQLDRDSEDFELMVSSAGLDQPFSLPRQYKKYINRKINIQLPEGNRFDAILTAVDENSITFKKLIKKEKSKKQEEGPEQKLSLEEIKETRPGVQF